MTTYAEVPPGRVVRRPDDIWPRVAARLVVLGWTAVYVAAVIWSTATLIAPLFGYYGFVSRSSTLVEWLVVLECTVFVALTMAPRCRRPSEVAVLFLVLTVAVPVMWIPLLYGPLDSRQVCLLALSTAGAFGLVWLVLRGARWHIKPIRVTSVTFWVVTALASALAVGYLLATGGPLDIVGFDDVYAQRDVYTDSITTLGAYLVGWLSGGLFPVLLAVGLYRRNALLLLLSVAGVMYLYAMSGQKTYVLGVGIIVGTYVMTRRGTSRTWHWLGLLTVAIVLVAALDRLRDGFEITSLLVRRGISTAGINTGYYIDLFDGSQHYELRHSVFSVLGPPPYDVAPAILVGQTYYTDGTIANANFLADGFANFGWAGVLASGLVVGLLLRVLDAVSADLPLAISAPSMVFVLQAAANTAILTTIMSHGAAVLVALVAFMPASVAATRWRRRRDVARTRASAVGSGERTVAHD